MCVSWISHQYTPVPQLLAHNGLAGRRQVRRVSPSVRAAPGGLCAPQLLAHNGLAGRRQVRRVSPSVRAAPGDLCAPQLLAHNGLAGRRQVRRVTASVRAAPGGLCAPQLLAHNGLAGRRPSPPGYGFCASRVGRPVRSAFQTGRPRGRVRPLARDDSRICCNLLKAWLQLRLL
jgi:hypothetical protein